MVAVAFFYASVGHGGASGYLALMAIFNMAPDVMRPTALVLNIFVSLIAFIQFYKARHFTWKLFLPLAAASIPMSFIGGLISLDQDLYKKILGVLLLFAVLRFFGFRKNEETDRKTYSTVIAILIGGIIGLLSGMIGIGGGIILSPVLLLLKWTNLKQTAAISALFIFVNSLAGLAGQLYQGLEFSTNMYALVAIAMVGGMAGSYFGAHKFNQLILKRVLAGVLFIAVIKLLTI
nr:sulfite exporter TauE/SafE family protein [Aridibaculum aurantiacum]